MPRANLSSARSQTWSGPPATAKQVEFLEILFNDVHPNETKRWRLHYCEVRGAKVNALDELSLRQATELIDDLKNKREAGKGRY